MGKYCQVEAKQREGDSGKDSYTGLLVMSV